MYCLSCFIQWPKSSRTPNFMHFLRSSCFEHQISSSRGCFSSPSDLLSFPAFAHPFWPAMISGLTYLSCRFAAGLSRLSALLPICRFCSVAFDLTLCISCSVFRVAPHFWCAILLPLFLFYLATLTTMLSFDSFGWQLPSTNQSCG